MALGAMLMGGFRSQAAEVAPLVGGNVEWKAVKLDPKKVAVAAYGNYGVGSCMYGSFRTIVEAMGEASKESNPAMSAAIKNFPFHLFQAGHSGVGGMGSLCGALNGCAAAFGLFVHEKAKCDKLTQELFGYYETTALPKWKPAKSGFGDIGSSVSGSVLCHVSQMKWCQASGYSPFSKERTERCKRLTVDIVTKAIEILNRYVENQDAKFVNPTTNNKSCLECHGKGGIVENVGAKMDCTTCHTTSPHPEMSATKK